MKSKTTFLTKAATLLIVALFSLTGARAQETLPFDCGFEDNENLEGWQIQGATTDYTTVLSNDFFIENGLTTSNLSHGGSNLFAFFYAEENGAYLVSPVFTGAENNQVSVSFYYRSISTSYPEQFQVGYTTDESVTDASQFTYGNTVTANRNGWQQSTNTFPAGTKRIAIKYIYTDAYFLLLDDFSFTLQGAPAKPTNLAVNYTQGNTTASVTWNRVNGASSYNIEVNGTVTSVTTTSYTITGIEVGKTYTVRVQAVNRQGLQSGWVSTSFFSGCPNEYTIPYAYGFEDEDPLNCWTVDGDGSITEGFAHEDSHSFIFSYTTTPPQYLISPRLSGIVNGLHVEFYYRQYTSGVETFKVGYSTTDNAPASFTWGEEITASTSYQRFSANYPANAKYVAVQHTSNDQYYLFLDDFLFEESASVLEPFNVSASNITTTSASINWTVGSDETSWDIYITEDATDMPDETTTPSVANTSDKPYDLTGLTQGTIYYVYVRAIKANEKSPWSSPVVFNTAFDPMALPYAYGFEDEELPLSWSIINTNTSYTGVEVMAPSSSSTNQVLAFYKGSSTGNLVAVLPEVDAAYSLKNYQISFEACYANSSNGSMTEGKLGIGIMTDPNDFSTFELIEEVDVTDGYSTFGSFTVDLSSYTGSGHYIAIQNIYTQNGYVLVDNIEVTSTLEPVTVTVGSVGYTTFVAPFNISELPEGLEAYACQANNSIAVHLEPVTAIPEGTAVVLKNAGTYTLTPATGSVELGADNDLLPSDGTVTGADGNIYALANKTNGVGFYRVGENVTVPAGKGYLVISSGEAKAFYGFFEDDATAIDNLNANVNANETIYNVAGQRINKMQKGINIINGKKILK